MRLYQEGLENFTPWSGAVDTYEYLADNDLLDTLEFMLEDLYPDGMTETEFNDLLWFESDWIYEMLGIKTYDVIQTEIDEIRQELADAKTELADVESDMIQADDTAVFKCWIDEIKEKIDDLQDQIADLQMQQEDAPV